MDDALKFHGWLTDLPGTVINVHARSAGQAKAFIYAMAADAFGRRAVRFTDVRVRRGFQAVDESSAALPKPCAPS